MGYDFASVINQANAAMAGSFNGSPEQRYSVLYPDVGRTVVKLLFCPKSNNLLRQFKRHTCSDDRTKVMCLRSFNGKGYKDCPICKTLDDVKNARGIDLYKYVAKTRGICYAHYISATKPSDRIQPGSIVLLMFPWTVYRAIQETVSTYAGQPDNLEKLIASNKGPAFIISRATDNRYTVQVDAMNIYSTCNNDEEFTQLLESLPPLENCIVHDPPTDEETNNMNSFANELKQKFLLNEPVGIQGIAQIAQNQLAGGYGQPYAGMGQQPQMPYGQSSAPASPQQQQGNQVNSNQNHPPCFGRQADSDRDPNECLMCPSQISCIDETRKRSSKPLSAEDAPF